MKKITKALLGLSIMVLPLSLIAGEIKYSQEEGNIIHKGMSTTLNGTITKKPKNGLNGIWSINGKDVVVDKHSFISNATKLNVGDKVIVIAHNEYGKNFVISIN